MPVDERSNVLEDSAATHGGQVDSLIGWPPLTAANHGELFARLHCFRSC